MSQKQSDKVYKAEAQIANNHNLSPKLKTEQSMAFHQNEESKISIKSQRREDRLKRGHWSSQEILKYYMFLYHNLQKFMEDEVRRSLRMFREMSIFINSRDAGQCRTHHHKCCQKYGGLQQNLQQFFKKSPNFKYQYQRQKERLDHLADEIFCGDFKDFEQNSPESQNQMSQQADSIFSDPQKKQEQKLDKSEQQGILPPQQAYKKRMEEWQKCYECYMEWLAAVQTLISKYQ